MGRILEAMLDVIGQKLAHGRRWELRDFGVLEVRTRAARMARNPRTGEKVPLPERKAVLFRPGKRMKEIVANSPLPTNPLQSRKSDDL